MTSTEEGKEKLTKVTMTLVEALVDNERAVQLVSNAVATLILFEVRVAEADFGKLIGRYGANAKMLRTFVRAAGRKYGLDSYVKIVSPTGAEWRSPDDETMGQARVFAPLTSNHGWDVATGKPPSGGDPSKR